MWVDAAVACILVGSLRAAAPRLLCAGHRLAAVHRLGLVQHQLWRRTYLHLQSDGMGGTGLPSARERRVRLTLVAGLPLRRQVEEVGLPIQVADRPERVRARDYDAAFSVAFRVGADERRVAARRVAVGPLSRI